MKDKFVHDIESARAEWANQIIGERDRLRAEVEILVWNLAGISTMACRRTPILYNGEMARPALDEVAELVKDYARLRAVNAELVEALEKLARLGNGNEYGDSDGNMIARSALSRAEQAKMETETETCVWKYDAVEGKWQTSCDHEECFEGYDPINTGFYTFCPFCGKRIEVKK